MSSKFQYQGRSSDTVKARANMQGGDFDSYLDNRARFMKVSEGQHTIRILPPSWKTTTTVDPKAGKWGDNWGIEVFIHRDIGPDKGAYLCPDKMLGKPCPICEARAELADDAELAKQLRPGKQTLAYVIDRDNEAEGPLVYRFGIKAEKEVQTRSQAKNGAIILIDDPEEGYDISFRRTGTKLNTDYVGWDIDRDPSYIHEKESKQEAWLEFIQDNPLPDLLIIHEYDYLDAIYRGKRSSKSDKADAEAGEGPSRSSRRDREAPAEEENRERGRSRGEPEEEDRRGRRSREVEEAVDDSKDARGSGRGRGRDELKDEEDDRLPTDKEMADNTERSRGRRSEPEPEERGRSRRREPEPEPEDKTRERSRSRDDGKGEEKGSSVKDAKERLERIRPKGK